MAEHKVTTTQDNQRPEKSYLDFAVQFGYQLHRIRYRADAARALLKEHEQSESAHELVGTSYMLIEIAELANNLAERLDSTSFDFVRASSKCSAPSPSTPVQPR